MCRGRFVYIALRMFRAGIESGISWLERAFGLDRCFWTGTSWRGPRILGCDFPKINEFQK